MATAELTLTNSFQLVIAGAAVVTLEIGAKAKLHIAADLPADNAAAHRLVRHTDRSSFTYNGSDNIYARKDDPADTDNVVIAFTA